MFLFLTQIRIMDRVMMRIHLLLCLRSIFVFIVYEENNYNYLTAKYSHGILGN